MSWLIVGTVPEEDFPLVHGPVEVHSQSLRVLEREVKIARGTPALAAFTAMAAREMGLSMPHVMLVGDTGDGQGSRALYAHLVEMVDKLEIEGFTFHYLLPDIYWHNQVLWAIQEKLPSAMLVADAGFMYVAKMSGFAADYDLFTPDIGEMCFLADETAPHPFYTRGFLLEDESKVEEYISRAYSEQNAARHLLVKGAKDYIVRDDVILDTVSEPSVAAMEAIGGTGDSLTGIVTARLMAGEDIPAACHKSALTNRHLGVLGRPTPAYSIGHLLPYLAGAMQEAG
ncbi:sugar kinase [Desulfonatronospira thiodismutans ASO3-1]|uniref:Sugar kinase n=1 Tax=Desulfonatronospira thiodismutans ASO3-1 TaxID=555779 RepID=D6SNL8_9BACT|nr:NAD(P)H-hydrate dehydratase [Desulfonatronospira thiodismutans]EFI34344.1 sugar kinase [Desulfonatronospira thiodismutans ASO3-1]